MLGSEGTIVPSGEAGPSATWASASRMSNSVFEMGEDIVVQAREREGTAAARTVHNRALLYVFRI